MTSQLPETTLLVWYCSRCRKSYKAQPPTEDHAWTAWNSRDG